MKITDKKTMTNMIKDMLTEKSDINKDYFV